MTGQDHGDERRFGFGENWARFLRSMSVERVEEAERSLAECLGAGSLEGATFVDMGSGSGLFSLAARRLGADVVSVDFDPQSVACTEELRRRFGEDEARWRVEQGSALDPAYLGQLGVFDVVYSWGVLHHTGDLWKALENVTGLVGPRGRLCVAIYNDQGWRSRGWSRVKNVYSRAPAVARPAIAGAFVPYFWGLASVRDLLRGRPGATWREYVRSRGMSPWIDVVDWVGGLPFEVATPDEVFDFLNARGFRLTWLRTVGGLSGNNQFVFQRLDPARA